MWSMKQDGGPPYHVPLLVPTNTAPGLDSGHFVSRRGRAGCVSVLLPILTPVFVKWEVRTIRTEVRSSSLSSWCVTTSHLAISVLGRVSVLLLLLFLIVEKWDAGEIFIYIKMMCDNFSSSDRCAVSDSWEVRTILAEVRYLSIKMMCDNFSSSYRCAVSDSLEVSVDHLHPG